VLAFLQGNFVLAGDFSIRTPTIVTCEGDVIYEVDLAETDFDEQSFDQTKLHE
jgi:hypothetical protein